jgi:hypothetical protein
MTVTTTSADGGRDAATSSIATHVFVLPVVREVVAQNARQSEKKVKPRKGVQVS